MTRIDKIVNEIGELNVTEVKELVKRLGELGLPPLDINVPVIPKTSPPSLLTGAMANLKVKHD